MCPPDPSELQLPAKEEEEEVDEVKGPVREVGSGYGGVVVVG